MPITAHKPMRALIAVVVIATAVALPHTGPLVSAEAAEDRIYAYRRLGAWVDIYDNDVFDRPETAVRNMHGRGVRTIFVETANSGAPTAIHRPDRMRRLIKAAHARKMKVVAWYLPTLKNTTRDYARVKAAIRFRTADGQRFDSFALDIESSAVKPTTLRNRRLIALSKRIRSLVGYRYPLGAIIPSPWAMDKLSWKYWRPFPYKELAAIYNVFLPMSYYTYHGDGASAAYRDTRDNIRVLRAQPGCANEPIHMIGGIANRSSTSEVRSFVKACREGRVQGYSLYAYNITTGGHWAELKAGLVRWVDWPLGPRTGPAPISEPKSP